MLHGIGAHPVHMLRANRTWWVLIKKEVMKLREAFVRDQEGGVERDWKVAMTMTHCTHV